MALLKCDFTSDVLSTSTSMTVIMPLEHRTETIINKVRKPPVLYLLHGYMDDHSTWTRFTSLERYVEHMGLAVIMPQVGHSYYTDMKQGGRYWTFLTEELPSVVNSMFHVSDKQEDTFVAGLSMGGYGALKWALRFPEKFAAAASMAGALDVASFSKRVSETRRREFKWIFGESDIQGTDNDLLWLLRKHHESGSKIPLLYQSCGTDDFLYEDNIHFRNACRSLGCTLKTEFEPGDHNWTYWDRKIKDVLNWLPLKNT